MSYATEVVDARETSSPTHAMTHLPPVPGGDNGNGDDTVWTYLSVFVVLLVMSCLIVVTSSVLVLQLRRRHRHVPVPHRTDVNITIIIIVIIIIIIIIITIIIIIITVFKPLSFETLGATLDSAQPFLCT